MCLFMGLILTNAFGQDKANNATQGWTSGTYFSPIYCDGVPVDYLEGGEIRIHYVYRYYGNIKIAKEIAQINGEVKSSSGEIFKILETDIWAPSDGKWFITCKYNLIGNWGTHYHGTVTFNALTGDYTIGDTLCN